MRDVRSLIDAEEYPAALAALEPQWEADPDNLEAAFYFGQMAVAEKPLMGLLAFKAIVAEAPHRWQAWVNLGACYSNLGEYDKAEHALRKALKLEPTATTAMVQMATVGVHRANPQQAIHWARKALKRDPESVQAHVDLALGSLLAGDYRTGWREWKWGMGRSEFRDVLNYGVPEWDGAPGTVVVYGEQGLGDEILMAQALTSVAATVIYDTHAKLAPLMRRTFPFEVYGTRLSQETPWLEGRHIDAAISLSGLQCLYRNEARDWDGLPYLKADPQRRLQWRALLDTLGSQPKVGIAWTGGRLPAERVKRSKRLAEWEAVPDDAVLVSLEYRDCTDDVAEYEAATGRVVHDWPRANQTNNLDDQAALVAELDAVVCVPTTVAHLAGALGVPCDVHMNEHHHAFWGKGESIPQYASVRIVR